MHSIKVSTALCLLGVVSAFPFARRQNSCGTKDFNGKLQFAVIPEGAGSGKQAQPTQIGDGQVQAPPVTQISDGQVQAPHVSQIPDGQVQAPHVSQIPDGQVQAPHVSQIPDGQVQAPHVSQIPDGQVQAPHVSQIPDGQVQAPQPSQIHDGQVQAPAGAAASGSGGGACNSNGLVLTLKNGQLFDQQGRYGYIASNSQFQFDNPVQAGGYGQNDWTVCGNNTLANAGKTTFYKCDSGSGFYNLYNMDYNPGACSAVHFLVSACS